MMVGTKGKSRGVSKVAVPVPGDPVGGIARFLDFVPTSPVIALEPIALEVTQAFEAERSYVTPSPVC